MSLGKIKQVSDATQACSRSPTSVQNHNNNGRNCAQHSTNRRDEPFNDRKSQLIGAYVFGYNSPPAAAREVFKPSTDSTSLVVPSQIKIFSFGFGVLLGVVTSGGVFAFLWPTLPGPRRISNGPTFWPKYLYETRLPYESLEPLIGFLAYLDEKLCHKNQKVVKNPTPKKGNQGGITPLLDMAITRC